MPGSIARVLEEEKVWFYHLDIAIMRGQLSLNVKWLLRSCHIEAYCLETNTKTLLYIPNAKTFQGIFQITKL